VQGNDLPLFAEVRIMEALEFIFARLVQWLVLEQSDEFGYFIHINGHPINQQKNTPYPPFRDKYIDNSFWLLFDMFLKSNFYHGEETFNTLNRINHSIIICRESSMPAQALTLSVAVEDLISKEFSDVWHPSEDLIKKVEQAFELIDGSHFDGDFKSRLKGSIGGIKKARADDILRFMVEKNVITQEQLLAWRFVRNKTAHGDFEALGSLQEMIGYCDKLLVLFYRLIFQCIGYEGRFTDYGVVDYPDDIYHTVKLND